MLLLTDRSRETFPNIMLYDQKKEKDGEFPTYVPVLQHAFVTNL
jgi:thioredoxin-related protein